MSLTKIHQDSLRKFHIWDLPPFLRVNLRKNARNRLFKDALKHTKTIKELLRSIKKETKQRIDCETVRDYKIGKYYIPIWFLNGLINLFFDKGYYLKIEKEIVAFRGPRGDVIYDPKFPWKEDERIIRIVFRLIGDGHGGGAVSKGRVPMYANTCNELIKQFIEDLNFFGVVKIRKYQRSYGKRCVTIEFPKVIGHIAKYLYNINFMGKYARLSNELYSLPKNLIIEGIKVFGDDEGSVKGTQIHFYSSNKELLQDFIKLFHRNLPEFKTLTDVRVNCIKNGIKYYYIAIRANDLGKYSQLIGFYHPLKKRRLCHQLKCKNKIKNNRGNYKTKDLILKSLLNRSKTSYYISEDILVNHRTVNKHMNGYSDKGRNFKGLKELGLVRPVYSSEGIIWQITGKGKTYKFCKNSLQRM